MICFSDRKSRTSPVPLSQDEDRKLRLAFGRFAEGKYRQEGQKVVSFHYERQRWFHCDCRPDAPKAPLLYPISGTHLRRENEGEGTAHDEACDFARDPEEQKRLVASYRAPAREDKDRLSILRNFSDGDVQKRSTISASTNRSRTTLARALCTILDRAKLNFFFGNKSLRGRHDEQISDIRNAAESLFLAKDQPLSDWLATSLTEFYDLKEKLEKVKTSWKRPHGLFIGAFDRVEKNALVPLKQGLKPVPVMGPIAVFGEADAVLRPPYLALCVVGKSSPDSARVEVLRAYVHPCVAWDMWTLVDSQLERETLKLLFSCRDWLAKEHGIEITIEKPLFDIGPAEREDPRDICIPDFVLRHRRNSRPVAVIETMGFDDIKYRERKKRMRALFERIRDSPEPIPVIEHDRLKPKMTKDEIDREFMRTVCQAFLGGVKSA